MTLAEQIAWKHAQGLKPVSKKTEDDAPPKDGAPPKPLSEMTLAE